MNVTRADRHRLEAIISDRSAPQKHVWRAKIILATADGCGTAEIMRRSGKSKPVVWRSKLSLIGERIPRPGKASASHNRLIIEHGALHGRLEVQRTSAFSPKRTPNRSAVEFAVGCKSTKFWHSHSSP